MNVRLRAFPSRDREFVAFVKAAWEGLSEPRTIEDLQHALRIRYPAAAVRIQTELARHGEGPEVWYAFRTSSLGVPPIADEEPIGAWAILDDERRFLEVSPGLSKIAELPARRMVGHRIEEFSNPSDPTIREDIDQLWTEFAKVRSIAATVRFNYADGRPRELGYRLIGDADGKGRHRLLVWVLPEPAGA